MNKNIQSILFLLLHFVISVKSQSYYFRHYQVENGLSNNTVFCCAQDNHGFLWMGTKDGLNRFDGYTFKVFRNDPDDSLSIGDNFIRSLKIDGDDNLYAGTRNGIYKYNFSTEKFSLVYKTTGEVRCIEKDKNNNLWFVNGQTLIKYNEALKAARVYNSNIYFSATSICIDSAKNIWVSTAAGFLERYDVINDSFTSYNIFKKTQHSSSDWIEKIYTANQQTILIGTSNYGIKTFSLKDFSFKDLLTYNADKTEIFARDFACISKDEFWIATESGVFIYNTNTQQFINLKKKYNNPYSISDNAVYSLCQDEEGGIWAGTYFGGVNYFPKQYNAFEKYFPDYTTSSLSGNAVREICEDKYNNLWIGTEDAGLNKFNKKSGIFTQYKPNGTTTGITYSNIHGLLAKGNELWIGTFEHGLDIMNIKTGKVIKHFPGDKNSNAFKSNFIVTIYQAKNRNIFIGTRQGLYCFDSVKNTFINIRQIPSNSFIHSIIEDNNGTLWIGTLGNGLFFYNPFSNKTGNFSYNAQNKKSISNNSITTIFQDSENTLWFGTEGSGLCRLNAKDSSFINYTSKDGLPGNTIFKMLEDSKKRLWITTSKGLVCFNAATKKINIFTTANGLLSDQFNYNSGYKDVDGKMYFGCVKGLISFDPDAFITNNFIPPVFITSIFVNNKEIAIDNNSSLTKSILFTRKIELPYNQSSISIDFAALTFTAPEMTKYKYIMEGIDKEWTYLKTNRKVYFTNLLPSTYIFKVTAANSSGKWNENETQLIIKISPPIWESTAAYFIYILIVALVFYFGFKIYHNHVAEKNDRKIELLHHEKEKEIYEAKINFFTNVAHEIRTPLTLIKAPLEKIIKKSNQNFEIKDNLRIMEKNTERLIELTNQLLDFRKIETNSFQVNFISINITELLMERFASFKNIADQKNISFTVKVPELPFFYNADFDSLHKILNNLFYNALTYCRSTVSVELFDKNEKNDFLTIEFRNDGTLIPVEMKEKIFEPFYRLKETQHKAGNGIGLALSRSLVVLHKGELYLKKTIQPLNIFVLKLPLSGIRSNC